VIESEIGMSKANNAHDTVVPFPQKKEIKTTYRKHNINRNKEGSVRKINGKVYIYFIYLEERVRECSGNIWNDKNARIARQQLDRIVVAIQAGTFRFAKVFPKSKRSDYFTDKERQVYKFQMPPDQVNFKKFAGNWYSLAEESNRLSGRTLHEYGGYLDKYLIPFFGDMSMAEITPYTLEQFISWARKRKLRKKVVSNNSINKYLTLLKQICTYATVNYRWVNNYSPFQGFKMLPGTDPIENIFPFSIDEQNCLHSVLSCHWEPYFTFAFASGLRPGEQIGINESDIDWDKRLIKIRRSITTDKNGHRVEGPTKNKYSRRTIKLTDLMFNALQKQKENADRFKCKYFFCTALGKPINLSNLRRDIWLPALKRAKLQIREIKQTRHTFATIALSCGESPLWIASVMGHKNTEMIIKHYTRYVENVTHTNDGSAMNSLYDNSMGKNKE
jgi:integrase